MTEQGALTAEAATAYKRYLEMTYGDLTDTERLAQYMFSVGFREAIAAMVGFQDLPDQARRLERRIAGIADILERYAA
jgi:hypothetical protein